MNTERAIKLINDLIDVYVTGREAETALKMAIEALRAQQERERFKDCHIWEIGDTLKTICDKCEVLIKASDIRVLMQQERENPQPLTLEQLRERVGKPVWIEWRGRFKACRKDRWIVWEDVSSGTIFNLYDPKVKYGELFVCYDHEPKEARDEPKATKEIPPPMTAEDVKKSGW